MVIGYWPLSNCSFGVAILRPQVLPSCNGHPIGDRLLACCLLAFGHLSLRLLAITILVFPIVIVGFSPLPSLLEALTIFVIGHHHPHSWHAFVLPSWYITVAILTSLPLLSGVITMAILVFMPSVPLFHFHIGNSAILYHCGASFRAFSGLSN